MYVVAEYQYIYIYGVRRPAEAVHCDLLVQLVQWSEPNLLSCIEYTYSLFLVTRTVLQSQNIKSFEPLVSQSS